jgi:hypothetical protein
LTVALKTETATEAHATEAVAADIGTDGLEQLDSRLGLELMTVPEPGDLEFVERTRKLIRLADMDARSVAAELLRQSAAAAHGPGS